MSEPIFHFTVSRGAGTETQISVPESELTESQRELLLGEVIHLYGLLPRKEKEKFCNYILTHCKERGTLKRGIPTSSGEQQ